MRTETLQLFKFSELSDDAKQIAIEQWRNDTAADPIAWQDELLYSFKAVFKTASVTLKDYELSLCSYSSVKIEMDQEVYDLTGARALAWLENNFLSKLRVTRAEYLKNRKDYFRYGYRVGKIKDCPLTGYCADESFIDALIESIKTGDCLGDAFKLRMPETYVKLLQAEYDDQNSDEYISETLEVNEYEFLETGKMYR